ncbi:MAG: proton-conducting transporter membrane subunit [Planctomyces sp.]
MTPELHFPWLELSILCPLLGAIVCGFSRSTIASQNRAAVISGITFLFAVGEWFDFTTLNSFAAHDHWDFIVMLLQKDVFVVDELSAPLLPLTALLFFLTIVSTVRTKAGRFSFGLTLLSEAITLATLSCTHPWVLLALLSIAIVPIWLELRSRGCCTRIFTLHMGLCLALLLGGWTLAEMSRESGNVSLLAALMMTMAALLRAGVVPLHSWLTDLFEHASFGSALLFVTPMTGAYAVMRLVFPIAPSWAMQSIAILSLITAVYAAGMSLVQTDARRFFCYLLLSHSSLVLVGLEIVTPIGMTGALCVWLSVGLSLGGLGLTLRAVESRLGRVSLDQFHGLFEHMPLLASLFLLTGLSSIGFPGTIGFVGMELLVEGTVEIYPLVGTALVLAAALNGISIVKVYLRLFTGVRHVATVSLQARPNERFAVVILSLLILGGGLWPQPGIHSRHHAATALLYLRSGEHDHGSSDRTDHGGHGSSALNRMLNSTEDVKHIQEPVLYPEEDTILPVDTFNSDSNIEKGP